MMSMQFHCALRYVGDGTDSLDNNFIYLESTGCPMQFNYAQLRYLGDGTDSLILDKRDKNFIYWTAQDVPCSPIVH